MSGTLRGRIGKKIEKRELTPQGCLALAAIAAMIQIELVEEAVVFAHKVVMNLAGSKSDLNLALSKRILRLVNSQHDLEE